VDVAYIPTTTTFRCISEQLQIVLLGDAFQHRQAMGIVTFATTTDSDLFAKIIPIPKGVTNYFRALNDALRELDQAGLDLILVEQPPESEEWGSVNERLRKLIQPLAKGDGNWTIVDTAIATAITYDVFFD